MFDIYKVMKIKSITGSTDSQEIFELDQSLTKEESVEISDIIETLNKIDIRTPNFSDWQDVDDFSLEVNILIDSLTSYNSVVFDYIKLRLSEVLSLLVVEEIESMLNFSAEIVYLLKQLNRKKDELNEKEFQDE